MKDELRVGEDVVRIEVSGEERLMAMRVEIPAGGGPPMLHRHDPFELYRVDEGELAFYLAREDGEVERRVAGAGESVAIAAGVEHTVRNESEATALATAVFAPAGEMEAFVRAAAELGPTPRPEDIIATAGSHGIEITRPIPAG